MAKTKRLHIAFLIHFRKSRRSEFGIMNSELRLGRTAPRLVEENLGPPETSDTVPCPRELLSAKGPDICRAMLGATGRETTVSIAAGGGTAIHNS